MDALGLIVVIVLIAAGARSITNAATAATKRTLARYQAAYKAARPRGPKGPSGVVIGTAAITAGLLTGLWLYARAGIKGAVIGWRYGRHRVLDWWQRRHPAPPPPPPPPSRVKQEDDLDVLPGLFDDPPQTPPVAAGEPIQPTTIERGQAVTVTSTPVEVTNIDTAIMEAQRLQADAQAEADDASAAAQRAAEDLQAVEAFHTAMMRLEMPDDVIGAVAKLIESNRIQADACGKRQQFAEARLAETQQVLDILRRHQGIQDAAEAAGGMGAKEAYVGA